MPNAIAEALALHRHPHNAVQLRLRALPDDVVVLLRTVTGDEAALRAWPSETKADECRKMAAQYLMSSLFEGKDDPLRLLALPETYSDETLKEHKRLFLKWLHPDSNPNADETKHFPAVMNAIKLIQNGYKPKPKSGDTKPKPAAPTLSARSKKSRLNQASVVHRAAADVRQRRPPPALLKFAASRRRVVVSQSGTTWPRKLARIMGLTTLVLASALVLVVYYGDLTRMIRP